LTNIYTKILEIHSLLQLINEILWTETAFFNDLMPHLWPRSISSFLDINFSFCSEKEINWSRAFLFTCEYFFNSEFAFSNCLNNCLLDIFLYLLNASVGKEPNSRIFFVHSWILAWKNELSDYSVIRLHWSKWIRWTTGTYHNQSIPRLWPLFEY